MYLLITSLAFLLRLSISGGNNLFTIIRMPNPKGLFSFRIPLKHNFGFTEDYDKIVYGFTQRLTLVRKADSDAIFKAAAADDGKVDIQTISWFMPRAFCRR